MTDPKIHEIVEKLRSFLNNESVPANDRASQLVFDAVEHAIDLIPVLKETIEQADAGRKAKKEQDEQDQVTLVCERLVGKSEENGKSFAMVTRGAADIRIPVNSNLIVKMEIGDAVWIDPQKDRIISRDGAVSSRGDIVRVESRPSDNPGHVIVNHHDRRELARLPQSLIDEPEKLQADDEVVYDPRTNFVVKQIKSESDGEELLADLETLKRVTDDDLGAPKPVLHEISDRLRILAEYPDWIRKMQIRSRCSYLFTGPTGTGKSYAANWVITQYHDYIERKVGRRVSRAIMLNMSDFWSQWFGETEQRISRWFTRLQNVASRAIQMADGGEAFFPVIVFVEECEALLRSRSSHDASSHLFDRPLALFLAKVDSVENAVRSPIVWICSSNKPELADSAALRRVASRQIKFGPLRASEAMAVLKKKTPENMPLRSDLHGTAAHEEFLRTVLGYLYGPEPAQPLAEIQMSNSKHHKLHRRDVVTPAMIDEAISWGVDRCLQRSSQAGRLLGLDAGDVIRFMQRHFENLVGNLRPHNVGEYAPDLVGGQSQHVTGIVPLLQAQRPITRFATAS